MREGAGAGSVVLRCGRRGQVRDRSKHPRERGNAKDEAGAAVNAVTLGSVVTFNQKQLGALHAPSSAKPSPRQQ